MNNKPTDHSSFVEISTNIYLSLGIDLNSLIPDSESKKYDASTLYLNNTIIKVRTAKKTPLKQGQFVTFWKRILKGPIVPYDIKDDFEILIINIHTSTHLGQFIFPKKLLSAYGLLSINERGGKRALRLYPPFETPSSRLAQKTQAWQTPYYVELYPHTNLYTLKKLLSVD